MMLFDFHKEHKFSVKRLSNADLKRSVKTNQTHIGLSNHSLTYLQNNKKEYSAMLIYGSFCDILKCEVGRIRRKNGTYDAPNVKSNGRNPDTVVKRIREFASNAPSSIFYLFWFGLDIETPVFWLICEGTTDYDELCKIYDIDTIKDRAVKTFDDIDSDYPAILAYAKNKLDNVSSDLQRQLIQAAETDDGTKFKPNAIKKAKAYIREIGRKGESIINDYLEQQKLAGSISDYVWENKAHERSLPYDFLITFPDGKQQWVDVKTTEKEFDQPVFISNNELNFIAEKTNAEYSIYRVYSMIGSIAHLKICSNCLKYIKKMQRDINYMTQSMSDYQAKMMDYKIAFTPSSNCFGLISNDVLIGDNSNRQSVVSET